MSLLRGVEGVCCASSISAETCKLSKVKLIRMPKLPVAVSVIVNGYLSLFIIPVMNW